MAVTSIWSVKGWLGKVVIYVQNPEKTDNPKYFEKENQSQEQADKLTDVIEYAISIDKTQKIDDENVEKVKQFVSGINCTPETARTEMMAVKARFGKEDGVVAYHGYQSFATGEATPEMAHEIGIKLAERLWGEKYQVIVATHLDKNSHLHNHFVLNTVSMIDGLRYHRTKKDYYQMQVESDKLCYEYSLSVIETPQRGRSKNYAEWRAEKEGKPTIRGYIRDDIDTATMQSTTEKHFLSIMKDMGYTFDFNPNHKYPTLQKKDAERCCRFASLGPGYDYPEILARIGRRMMRETPPKPPNISYNKYFGKAERKGRLKGFKRIYTRYMFLMGIIPKGNPIKPTHPLIRQAVIQMRQIQKEYKLLAVNSITTDKQLLYFKQSCEEKQKSLCDKRNENRRLIRNEKNPNRLILLKNEVADLTTEISELRQKCKLCDSIQTRSVGMQEQLVQISLEEKNQIKEENRNEHIGRSGRPNR